MKSKQIAIVYDFDGTLTPQPMQEYTILPELGLEPESFWREVSKDAQDNGGDPMLSYLRLMIEKANEHGIPLRKEQLTRKADEICYFQGVEAWFERLNTYVSSKSAEHAELKHYIISCGNREIIEACSIAKHFSRIYGSAYHYDYNGVASFPAVSINDTSKTQFLFRINKGREEMHLSVNEHMPLNKRPIPFSRIIYIGDGMTDVPCMAVCRQCGGHAIAVHNPEKPSSMKVCEALLAAKRIDFFAPADYREGSTLDTSLKAILDYILAEETVLTLSSGKRKRD